VSKSSKTVIPRELKNFGRDPWFDGLTTLSEVERDFIARAKVNYTTSKARGF
jgi:hypothetical protein